MSHMGHFLLVLYHIYGKNQAQTFIVLYKIKKGADTVVSAPFGD